MAAVGSPGVMASVSLMMMSKQMDQMKVQGAQMAELTKQASAPANIVTATKIDARV